MVDSFKRLGHNTIVSGNNEYYDIRNLCTAGTHHGKCFVTWSIKECNGSLWSCNLVGTNLLGNTASFAFCNVCIADCVQSLCLTVVNVTHYGNDRRPYLYG